MRSACNRSRRGARRTRTHRSGHQQPGKCQAALRQPGKCQAAFLQAQQMLGSPSTCYWIIWWHLSSASAAIFAVHLHRAGG